MVIRGRVKDGVIVLEGGTALPEGADVTVVYSEPGAAVPSVREKARIEVPLVRSERPGSVELSGEQIAVFMDQEDASPRR
jgi:hypothetical protein